MTDATIFGYTALIFFFYLIGYRLKSVKDIGKPTWELIARVGEIASYCFAGLIATVMSFIIMELGSAAAYFGVLRGVFTFMIVTTGLIAGVGAFVASIVIVVMGISNIVVKKRGRG